MHEALKRNVFVVKEHVGLFKAANNYDIYDPETSQVVMECREPNLGPITKVLRFTDFKRMTPFDIQIKTPQGESIVSIQRGISFLISDVKVYDELNHHIGGFKQKFLSIGGAFDVLDQTGQKVCSLKGKWTGWDFKFLQGETELAHVSKKWSGLGKELFTSADTYVLEIADSVAPEAKERLLILAAVMCIDMVLKE